MENAVWFQVRSATKNGVRCSGSCRKSEYITGFGCSWNNVGKSTARGDHPVVQQWARVTGCDWDAKTFFGAALGILKYPSGQGPMDATGMPRRAIKLPGDDTLRFTVGTGQRVGLG